MAASSGKSPSKKPAPKQSAPALKAEAPARRAGGGGRGGEGARDEAPPAPSTRAQPVVGLDAIVGQESAVGVLRSSLASGRIHHAWVFAGPAGVGKRTAAMAFAWALLDPTTAPDLSGSPAPEAGSATHRLIESGAHPDLHLITKELARFSEDKQTRERKLLTIPRQVIDDHLLRPIALAPSIRVNSLARKLFIIDEAELLDRSRTHAPVQNALLKTLEEPPPGSVIILVTSAEEMLLPTIRSRCQRVAFGALDEKAMSAWFARWGIDVPREERRWLEWFAQGSPGRALLAARTGLHGWWTAIEPMLAEADRARFSPELGSTMAKLVDEWAAKFVEENENASKEAANLAGARHMLALVGERAREALRAHAAEGPVALERPLRAIDLALEAERAIAANVSLANAFEDLSAQLASA